MLVGITLLMGIADGCFVSVMGPIAFDLCGQKGAAQAIGCILGLCSIPLTVGPPIAGKSTCHLMNLNILRPYFNGQKNILKVERKDILPHVCYPYLFDGQYNKIIF